MGNVRRARLMKGLVVFVAAVLMAGVLEGQTSQHKKTKKHKVQVGTLKHSTAHTDSMAAARADSLRAALEARATADSLSRRIDSLSALRSNDSLLVAQLRTVADNAFRVGEELVFDVNFGFITAGTAVMSIPAYDTVSGRECFRVEFTVNSLPSFSWIYKVEDRYLTFIDVQSIAPWKFEQHIREGSYRRDFIAEFDQVHHVATTTEGVHTIPPYVHDIMSAFYYTRTLDFSNTMVGEVTELHNFYKDTTYELGVKFLGRQDLDVAAGSFHTIVVEPLVKEGGLFKSEGRIVIWLTDDELKVPVRVNTKVVIGSIDSELRSYSGLAGPLRARFK